MWRTYSLRFSAAGDDHIPIDRGVNRVAHRETLRARGLRREPGIGQGPADLPPSGSLGVPRQAHGTAGSQPAVPGRQRSGQELQGVGRLVCPALRRTPVLYAIGQIGSTTSTEPRLIATFRSPPRWATQGLDPLTVAGLERPPDPGRPRGSGTAARHFRAGTAWSCGAGAAAWPRFRGTSRADRGPRRRCRCRSHRARTPGPS